jgi:hypothetical protein
VEWDDFEKALEIDRFSELATWEHEWHSLIVIDKFTENSHLLIISGDHDKFFTCIEFQEGLEECIGCTHPVWWVNNQ